MICIQTAHTRDCVTACCLQMCCEVLQKDSSHDAIKEELTATSKARREEMSFIYVEPTGNDGALEYFGLKAKDMPAYVIHDQTKDAKFVNKNIAAGSLSGWLDEFKARACGCCCCALLASACHTLEQSTAHSA